MVECEDVIGKIENRTLPMPAGPLPFHVYTPMAADEPSGGVTLCRHHVHRIGAAQSEAAGPSQRTIDASEVCAPVLHGAEERLWRCGAEAIAEAVQRPTMKFVATKTAVAARCFSLKRSRWRRTSRCELGSPVRSSE